MNHRDDLTVHVDWYTRACLTVIAVLLTVLVVGLWAETPSMRADAQTKYADADAAKAIQQGRWGTSSAEGKLAASQVETNQRLEELVKLFSSGQAKVQIVGGSSESGGDNADSRQR